MKLGDIIKVTFDDHCEDGDKPMVFVVYGVLTKRASKYIIVKNWTTLGDAATDHANNKRWVIIRSCIRSMVRLVEEK